MTLKPTVEEKALLRREVLPILEQQTPEGESSAVSGDFFSPTVDGREEQPQHVEFVGDEKGFGKEALRKVPKGIAHVHDDVLDIGAARDVAERVLQLHGRPPVDELFHPLAFV